MITILFPFFPNTKIVHYLMRPAVWRTGVALMMPFPVFLSAVFDPVVGYRIMYGVPRMVS